MENTGAQRVCIMVHTVWRSKEQNVKTPGVKEATIAPIATTTSKGEL